jgi:uncharacterized protein YaiL (DUF2058 family)
MLSLKDKLLKAGLVSEEQAQKVEAEKASAQKAAAERAASRPQPAAARQPHAPRRREMRDEVSTPVEARNVPKFAPLPGSKAWNQEEARKQQALDRQLRELVLAAQVAMEPGDRVFHFQTRKGKLRRLDLSAAQATLLEEGKLAVVERPDPAQIEHALIPVEVAEKMLALSERSVRFLNKDGANVGFLSEEEIHQRAVETAAAMPSAQTEVSPPAPALQTETATAPAAVEAEVWVTIKRG